MTSHTGGASCIWCIDNQKILVYWDLELYLGSKGSQTPLCLFTCMHIAIITISWTMLWYFTYLGTYIYIYSRNNSNYSLYWIWNILIHSSEKWCLWKKNFSYYPYHVLKSIFLRSEIGSMRSSGFSPKRGLWFADLSVLPIRVLFFGGKTTWTHFLTRISEKTGFTSYIYECFFPK